MLKVRGLDGLDYTFELPYSIEFQVTRNNLATPNNASITIYNLAAKTRAMLRKDGMDYDVTRPVTLAVGYGSQPMTIIFFGVMQQGYSVRQGVDYVTTITAQDASLMFTSNQISISFGNNTPLTTILNLVLEQIRPLGYTLGYSVPLLGVIPRGQKITGYAVEILSELLRKQVYIDNAKLMVVDDENNEFSPPEGLEEISYETGLIGTPTIENSFIRADLIMEPRIFVGQKIGLKSLTAQDAEYAPGMGGGAENYWGVTQFNGEFRVTGVTHSATISPVVAGNAITTVQLASPYIIAQQRGLF